MSNRSGISWRRIKQFRALAPLERRLFVRAIVLLPLTALVLRLCGFRRCCVGLERLAAPQGRQALATRDVFRGIRCALLGLRLAVRYGPYGGNCLSRSLVLWWLLRRQGIESDLRIGTRTSNGQFQAHAWVEYRGYPLNEGQDVYQRYTVFSQAIQPEAKTGAS